jgi:hypothetical protein
MIPSAALLQHVAILGKTGSGKTYTAKGLVEGILDDKRRLAVVDPTGAWWGLRSSADGKAAGYPVIVLGGQHGDAPLPPESGAACAELITRNHLQVVFDTGDMSVGERTRWFIGFAGHLFRLNRTPIHVVIDEAHMFAPQSGGGAKIDIDTGKMLHACNTLASGGRSRGVRLMLITQRPAKLHKDSLTCCDTLIAMRLIAPQDREAVKDWIDGCGDARKGKEVLDSLASLGRGEGWAWYPEGNYLERLAFPRIRTFDSSATPTDGEAPAAPKTLADIDLSAVNAALTAAVEEARANDPKLLRAEVDRLRRELADEWASSKTMHAGELGRAQERIAELEAKVASLASDSRMHVSIRGSIAHLLTQAIGLTRDGESNGIDVRYICTSPNTPVPPPGSVPGGESCAEPPVPAENGSLARVRAGSAGPTPRGGAGANGSPAGGGNRATPAGDTRRTPHERIIDAIAWWDSIGVGRPTRVQVAVVAGYTASGGTFMRYVSSLSGEGKIVYPDSGTLELTRAGWDAARAPDTPASLERLHAIALAVIDAPHRKIMHVLLRAGGRPVGRTEVAEQSGYEATGGTFMRYVSHLSGLGLVVYPRKTTVAAAPILFPEGLR